MATNARTPGIPETAGTPEGPEIAGTAGPFGAFWAIGTGMRALECIGHVFLLLPVATLSDPRGLEDLSDLEDPWAPECRGH